MDNFFKNAYDHFFRFFLKKVKLANLLSSITRVVAEPDGTVQPGVGAAEVGLLPSGGRSLSHEERPTPNPA